MPLRALLLFFRIKLDFKFYKPRKLLQPYVRYYWVFKSALSLTTFTFPIGCPQIIFHKQRPLYVPELNVTQDKLTISGQVNFSSHLCAEGGTEMIVAVFHPHTMGTFLHVPMSLFYNREVCGYDLEDKELNALSARINGCGDNDLCVSYVEEWLLAQIAVSTPGFTYNMKRMETTIYQIYAAPQTSVTELSSIACLSKKQFERQFSSLVGINPKEYTRIVRFQKALAQMQNLRDVNSMAQTAYASGYADQSHMTREFKRLCGHTPLSLLKMTNPYSDLFSQPV